MRRWKSGKGEVERVRQAMQVGHWDRKESCGKIMHIFSSSTIAKKKGLKKDKGYSNTTIVNT